MLNLSKITGWGLQPAALMCGPSLKESSQLVCSDLLLNLFMMKTELKSQHGSCFSILKNSRRIFFVCETQWLTVCGNLAACQFFNRGQIASCLSTYNVHAIAFKKACSEEWLLILPVRSGFCNTCYVNFFASSLQAVHTITMDQFVQVCYTSN